MAEVLDRSPAHLSPILGVKYDRAFYGGIGALLGLIALVAFAPTYYLTFFSGGPTATVAGAPFTALVHLHGALFTAWMLFFIAQTALVANRRVALHRQLGVLGALLATAMVVSAARLAIAAAARGDPPGAASLVLLISLWDLALFASFVIAALSLRRDRESHKRLMLLAYITIVKFAVTSRLIGPTVGLPAIFGVTLLLIMIPALYDLVSRRKIHKVYVWGGALMLVSMPVRFFLSGTSVWGAIMEFLTS